MSAMVAAQGEPAPRPMSVRTKIIIGALLVLFAALHAQGMAMMISASDASPAESASLLRGD
jgi:hypothetical protein